MSTLTITSPGFKAEGPIPSKYTCEGENISPALKISGIPEGTKSLAIIMDDPESPKGVFDHWLMWNIEVTDFIEENSKKGIQGLNSNNQHSYSGPFPTGTSRHCYHFRVYALDISLDILEDSDKRTLVHAMENHILAAGSLVGVYEKTAESKPA